MADLAAAAHLSSVDYLGDVPWDENADAKALVSAHQVATILPAAARRPDPRHARPRPPMPISISEAAPGKAAGPIETRIKAQARALGLASASIARLDHDAVTARRFDSFIAADLHGDMDWLSATPRDGASPTALWPEAQSAIMVAMNYGQEVDPMQRLGHRDRGVISVYALGRDYHEVIKGKLKQLAGWLRGRRRPR